jgi:hypothetical protein
MSIIENRTVVKISFCINFLFAFLIVFLISYHVTVRYAAFRNVDELVAQRKLTPGSSEKREIQEANILVSSEEPKIHKQPGFEARGQRILDSFAIRTRPGALPKAIWEKYSAYYTNPSPYYGHQLTERLKTLGYALMAECNPTINTWYFTGTPDYLLMRKFTPTYNVVLSFKWLLTEEQRFFKCTIKFESPEDHAHDDGFQLKTNPLKITHQPYMGTVSRDLREVLTAMLFPQGRDGGNSLADEKDLVLFENVINAFEKIQESKSDLRDMIEIRFFADMNTVDAPAPISWLWVFQIGCDSVSVYSGHPALFEEKDVSPPNPFPNLQVPDTSAHMPGYLSNRPPREGIPEPESVNIRYPCLP